MIAPTESPRTSSAGAALRDARGLACGTCSQAAVDALEDALETMLSYFGDPLSALDEAAAHDPGWALPRVLKASLLLTLGEHDAALQAHEILAAAADARQPNEREGAHVAAAQAAAAGDWDGACARWEAILVRWPRDIAALFFAHLFDFYRGDAANLKRRPQRVLPHWSPDLPKYSYVLGMHAFGLEESGHYDEAQDAGLAALEANRRDPWAVHAVTHVYEMRGRHEDGSHWLRSRRADWAVDNGLAFHNWFHSALFELERLDTDAALATFDAYLAPATEMALQRVDGTAILWRLKLLGVDVTSRFDALRRCWAVHEPAAGFYAFNDLHALIAHIGAGDTPELHAACDAIGAAMSRVEGRGPTNRRMAAEVGAPLAQAFLDYSRGKWDDAAQALLEVRERAHGFGGSHAQRDILNLTLLDASIRAGDRALASHILNERRPQKSGTALTSFWEERIAQPA